MDTLSFILAWFICSSFNALSMSLSCQWHIHSLRHTELYEYRKYAFPSQWMPWSNDIKKEGIKSLGKGLIYSDCSHLSLAISISVYYLKVNIMLWFVHQLLNITEMKGFMCLPDKQFKALLRLFCVMYVLDITNNVTVWFKSWDSCHCSYLLFPELSGIISIVLNRNICGYWYMI